MEAYYHCLRCKDRRVRILTVHGETHEGVITDVDRNHVFLRRDSSNCARTSGFFGFNDDIITLSLFTLLAIALI
ncbi:hypothetical protein BVG16_11590 [Paenibacillus selenitireducens]|uniref:Cellobiose phosphorylase n=1 Tax=Paenibacillus selenitireducens TaxID=1324314 RepID=A0A1T2XFP7_9BACL|nr:hypothetical protein [Paenibacillus selenitireducens]OPA78506.1 hypothetical protein BVG16_11590 [Paenibacillus selenitireducens]